MRELLYRPSWQLLRVSFLKDNRRDGGWTSGEGTRKNLNELDAYVHGRGAHYPNQLLMEASTMGWSEDHEMAIRLYRAINCLNAVRMGYSGQGVSTSKVDTLVLEMRNDLQSEQTVAYHRQLTFAAERWDWGIVKRELEHIQSVSNLSFEQIDKSLKVRQKKSNMEHRPELDKFLKLMEDVKVGR